MLVLNFPANPTTMCVEIDFFERVVEIAREHNIWVVQDLAYADIVFDGYIAPSILQVDGAKTDCSGILLAVKKLQHAGMASWVCCRQQRVNWCAG